MNSLVYIILILTFIIAVMLVFFVIFVNKYKRLKQDYNDLKIAKLREYNALSMIEYHIKNYKEGNNIFTVFRNISDIIYSIERNK